MSASHLLTDSVSFKAPSTLDTDGDPTFGSLTTVAARVEYTTKHVASDAGIQRVTITKIMTEVEIPVGSRVWLPGKDTAQVSQSLVVDGVAKASTPGGYTLFLAEL